MYTIKKVFNNNTVSCWNEKNEEVIIKGLGIGFHRKSGDFVENQKIEKIFELKKYKFPNQFVELLERIPYEIIYTTELIISYASQSLNMTLNEHLLIDLSDHISYSIERLKENLPIRNPMLWEIKHFYQKEYEIGKEAIRIIQDELHVLLNDDEAGFIAFHIVNAELNVGMEKTMQMTTLMQNILNIIRIYFKVTFKEDQLAYSRLMIHLKYFVQRAICKEQYIEQDEEFVAFVRKKYPNEYKCTNVIANFMKKEIDYDLSEEEKLYLTIHIYRVIRDCEEE